MGIYDRDYYRGDERSFLGGLVDRGAVCKWLIGLNVAVFILQLIARSSGDAVTRALALDVNLVLDGQAWRLLTYAFVHDPNTPLHILFNMLFLAWFGREVEDLYGPREFLAFYLLSALLGGVVFALTGLAVEPELRASCVGASGAVTAVMVLFAFHYPTRVVLLFMLLPVPVWALVAFSVAKDLFDFLGKSSGGVAVQVHLAGALFGFLYYRYHWRLSGWAPRVRDWWRRRRRPPLRLYRPEPEAARPAPVGVAAATAAAAHVDDDQLDAKVDAVLAKLKQVGSRDKLTEGEREVLIRASEVFRKRRS